MRFRSSEQQDHILRLIQQAAEALRRLRGRLGGGDAPEVVRQDAAAAIGALLGAEGFLLTRLDAESAARLAGDAARVSVWADLLDVDAEAAAAAGDAAAARASRARAASLRAAASALADEPPR
jgi:hypothetical protein